MMRRAIAALLAVTALLSVWLWYCHATRPWREWQAFARVFVQADGRVIDRTAGSRSTSEAQAYGLFFAFVANDRERFARILGWTANNLAGGDLKTQLPAWLWGLKPDGSWGVIDANPASDADLWLAYTLIEAARLWRQPEHRVLGEAILRQVKAQEIAEVPGFGLMLIPAPQGFKAEDGGWRLNPSYLPEFQLRRLAAVDPGGPWAALWQNHLKAMRLLLTKGIAPDWYQVTASGELRVDAITQGVSSYDAIRVPLWAGMTPARGGGQNELARLLAPLAAVLARTPAPPEKLDSTSGAASGGNPVGFSAAVLPFLATMDEDNAVRQRQRLENSRKEGNLGSPPHYYDQALAMFGEGWDQGRFRFGEGGEVIPRWEKSCCEWLYQGR